MLGWAIAFLVVALITALLGLGGMAASAVGIAKVSLFIGVLLFFASAVFGALRERRT